MPASLVMPWFSEWISVEAAEGSEKEGLSSVESALHSSA